MRSGSRPVRPQLEDVVEQRQRLADEAPPNQPPASTWNSSGNVRSRSGPGPSVVSRQSVAQQHGLARRAGAHVVADAVEPELERPAQSDPGVLRRVERHAARAEEPRWRGSTRGPLDAAACRAGSARTPDQRASARSCDPSLCGGVFTGPPSFAESARSRGKRSPPGNGPRAGR